MDCRPVIESAGERKRERDAWDIIFFIMIHYFYDLFVHRQSVIAFLLRNFSSIWLRRLNQIERMVVRIRNDRFPFDIFIIAEYLQINIKPKHKHSYANKFHMKNKTKTKTSYTYSWNGNDFTIFGWCYPKMWIVWFYDCTLRPNFSPKKRHLFLWISSICLIWYLILFEPPLTPYARNWKKTGMFCYEIRFNILLLEWHR